MHTLQMVTRKITENKLLLSKCWGHHAAYIANGDQKRYGKQTAPFKMLGTPMPTSQMVTKKLWKSNCSF
jgi:hypothetical protein